MKMIKKSSNHFENMVKRVTLSNVNIKKTDLVSVKLNRLL